MILRVATSGKFADGLATIQQEWSFSDLMAAHQVLDLFERAASESERRAEMQQRKQRGGRR